MKTKESIEDFYLHKFGQFPDNFTKGIGHINVFDSADFAGKNCSIVPYIRKDYYKISLLIGKRRIMYVDKTAETSEFAIMFSNPDAPYQWQGIDKDLAGYCVVFTPDFLDLYPDWKKLSVFNVKYSPFYNIKKEQVDEVATIYRRMQEELKSKYVYKYDLLRILLMELVHYTIKNCMNDIIEYDYKKVQTSSKRITIDFIELLESQFPVDNPGHLIRYTTASDFSEKLNVHINHLNKSVKTITGKSTTEIIAERILHESKILLKTTNWNISEIAYALRFKEPTHFNNFFRKKLNLTPSEFRND